MSQVEVQGGGEPLGVDTKSASRNPFARLSLFIKQVIAELSKVVTPTRSELGNYFLVVMAFVLVVMGFVYALDMGLGKLAFWAFATPDE